MLRRLELGFVAAAGLLACLAANADVYKYTDAKGNVEYTDKPHALPAERLNVQTQKSEEVKAAPPSAASKPADSTESSAAADAAAKKPAKAPGSDETMSPCERAKQKYDAYSTAQRLYEDKGNGERRYLTDQELDAARAAAKVSRDTLCK
jgi:hypothetical protein